MTAATRMTLRAAAIGLLVLALSASSVATADAQATSSRSAEAVDLAGAAWTDIHDGTATYITLTVADSVVTVPDHFGPQQRETTLLLFYDRIVTNASTGDRAHVSYESLGPVEGAIFEFDPSLQSATARVTATLRGGTVCRDDGGPGESDPDPIATDDVGEDDCVPLPDVTMAFRLDWTGVGPVDRDTARFRDALMPTWRVSLQELTMARGAGVTATVEPVGDTPAEFVWPSTAPGAGVLLRGRRHMQFLLPRTSTEQPELTPHGAAFE